MCSGSLSGCTEYVIASNVLKMTLGAGFAAIITTSTSNYPGLVNAENPDLRAGPGLQDIFADFFPISPTGKLPEVLDKFRILGGVQYIRIEIDALGVDRAQLLAKVCIVEDSFIVNTCQRAYSGEREHSIRTIVNT